MSDATDKRDPDDLITDPLTPEAVDGHVQVVDPPAAALNMTADAASATALRLLDAAQKAQEWIDPSLARKR